MRYIDCIAETQQRQDDMFILALLCSTTNLDGRYAVADTSYHVTVVFESVTIISVTHTKLGGDDGIRTRDLDLDRVAS